MFIVMIGKARSVFLLISGRKNLSKYHALMTEYVRTYNSSSLCYIVFSKLQRNNALIHCSLFVRAPGKSLVTSGYAYVVNVLRPKGDPAFEWLVMICDHVVFY